MAGKYVIYNLAKLLRNELPAETLYVDQVENTALEPTTPDRAILLRGTGGLSAPWLKYTGQTFQVLTRDLSRPGAARLAKDIFDILHGRFGLILPAALNVDGKNYAAVQTAQIKAVQLPYNLGQDAAGRTSYTTNYVCIYLEE